MSNIIDFNIINNLKEIGDQEFLVELIDIFLGQSQDLIDEIKSGAEKKDNQIITKAAHKLKGSCLNLGAMSMGEVCQDIEHTSRDNNLSDIELKINELMSLHKETCEELIKLK